jgi:hypothetical protein
MHVPNIKRTIIVDPLYRQDQHATRALHDAAYAGLCGKLWKVDVIKLYGTCVSIHRALACCQGSTFID